MEYISGIGITAILVVIGLMLNRGKWAFLVAGYNTSNEKERAKYDELALCKGMAKLMFAMAGLYLLLFSGNILQMQPLVWIGIGGIVLSTIGFVIYANTGGRYRKK